MVFGGEPVHGSHGEGEDGDQPHMITARGLGHHEVASRTPLPPHIAGQLEELFLRGIRRPRQQGGGAAAEVRLRAAHGARLCQAPAAQSRAPEAQGRGDEGGACGRVAVQLVLGLVLLESGPVLPYAGGLDGPGNPERGRADHVAAAGRLEVGRLEAHVEVEGQAGVAVVVSAVEFDEAVESRGVGADYTFRAGHYVGRRFWQLLTGEAETGVCPRGGRVVGGLPNTVRRGPG